MRPTQGLNTRTKFAKRWQTQTSEQEKDCTSHIKAKRLLWSTHVWPTFRPWQSSLVVESCRWQRRYPQVSQTVNWPYKVTNRLSDITYKIQDLTKQKTKIVLFDRLKKATLNVVKLYQSDEEEMPERSKVWLWHCSGPSSYLHRFKTRKSRWSSRRGRPGKRTRKAS